MSAKKPAAFLAEGYTPMMAQYLALRVHVHATHPGALLFYRIGEFYELLAEDAELAAPILGIALTSRGKGPDGAAIPLCGVPVSGHEGHLARLVRAGHKVAVCEERADDAPISAKSGRPGQALRARVVARIVTPGTLTESALLDPRESNYLAALSKREIAWCDASTGAFFVQELAGAEAMADTLARLDPGEIVVAQGWGDAPLAPALRPWAARVSAVEPFTDAAQAARAYLLRTAGPGAAAHIGEPRRVTSGGAMEIDASTRRNLELTRTAEGGRKGSLLHAIDRCTTVAGSRTLAADIAAPLTDPTQIAARLDRVEALAELPEYRDPIRQRLSATPDMARALGRVAAGRWAPADLVALRGGLAAAEHLRGALQGQERLRRAFAGTIAALSLAHDLAALALRLREGLADDGTVTDGLDTALDTHRAAHTAATARLVELEDAWRKGTGVARLKVKHNAVLGYFVEVPARSASVLMAEGSGFTHRQTLSGAVRFRADSLAETEREIAESAQRAQALERTLLEAMAADARTQAEGIRAAAAALARLDVAAGLAALAAEKGWTRPEVLTEPVFDIAAGRHAVLDGPDFTPNACDLSGAGRMMLLTGPNMAGKSTFLRQNALIAVLAQAGSFVPAGAARIGAVDRLFARVGAGDDLAGGRSTFLVEMQEVAAILERATDRSLIILDEIGRGTATFDGIAIAWACLEYLAAGPAPRALVSTHYHELTELAETLEGLSCHHMAARAAGLGLEFLYTVEPGVADGSFGLHAARLAGLPGGVLARAESVLASLSGGSEGPD